MKHLAETIWRSTPTLGSATGTIVISENVIGIAKLGVILAGLLITVVVGLFTIRKARAEAVEAEARLADTQERIRKH